MHLAERHPVEYGSSVESNVVESGTFSVATRSAKILVSRTYLKPKRKRHFCHSINLPVTLKLTPSGCET